ncbi:MAG: DUF3137 domain-containing protein [Bacteroidales bacterium]|nr:DUF3137 domain-containing protein [Bacteroidales bacterium]
MITETTIEKIENERISLFKINKLLNIVAYFLGIIFMILGVFLVRNRNYNAGFPIFILGFLIFAPLNILKRYFLNKTYKKEIYRTLLENNVFFEYKNRYTFLSSIILSGLFESNSSIDIEYLFRSKKYFAGKIYTLNKTAIRTYIYDKEGVIVSKPISIKTPETIILFNEASRELTKTQKFFKNLNLTHLKHHLITTDNLEFNKQFFIWAEDEQFCQKILTSDFMKLMLNIAKEYKISISWKNKISGIFIYDKYKENKIGFNKPIEIKELENITNEFNIAVNIFDKILQVLEKNQV